MFANKGRLKVALLVIGFLVASLGMYAGFQIEKAEAQGGRIRQWTVTIKGTAVYGSYELQTISKACKQCPCYIFGKRHQNVLKDYVATIHYFDDGENVYSEPGTFTWVSGTQKAGSTYDVWRNHTHYDCTRAYFRLGGPCYV